MANEPWRKPDARGFCQSMLQGQPPAILINSLPKAGTHLLEKVLSLFPNIQSSGLWLHAGSAREFPRPEDSIGPSMPIGVNFPTPAPVQGVRQVLGGLRPGDYVKGHVPF